MPGKIDQELITRNLFDILDEAFIKYHGIFLDQHASLFETLETITAAEASISIGGKGATLAAQVAHLNFSLEGLEAYLLKKDISNLDWGEIWRRVNKVSTEEWKAYQNQLKETYQRVLCMLQTIEDWNDERPLGGTLAVIVHTAYHLGEIRQALCILKS